jgi:hypothetical protein
MDQVRALDPAEASCEKKKLFSQDNDIFQYPAQEMLTSRIGMHNSPTLKLTGHIILARLMIN